ncbi:hypothetical protein, partial [Lacticaseibacillus chiayiensis]|uniref:hypothetical protein n=1 Tax=Lacticaseibacillus chiayiensis TaxID=2100821 RepID=UPI001EDC95FF
GQESGSIILLFKLSWRFSVVIQQYATYVHKQRRHCNKITMASSVNIKKFLRSIWHGSNDYPAHT